MKSVRLDRDLQADLRRAAEASGSTESEFIREAVRDRCRKVLRRTKPTAAELWGPAVGCISAGGNAADAREELLSHLDRREREGRVGSAKPSRPPKRRRASPER